MALGLTESLIEISTRILLGGERGDKASPALKTDNLSTIYEPIV
jgi:hypothetical protein